MGWDCYCAICGGPFLGVELAVKTQEQARKKKRRQTRADVEEDDDDEDDDDDDSEDEWQIGYDPSIVSKEDIKWTGTLLVLGFNEEAPGPTKCYISGPGEYSDVSYVVGLEAGDDPNFDEDREFYRCYFPSDSPVFPFHWPCYELLVTALTGTSELHRLSKDLLYLVFHELTLPCERRLIVDYGRPKMPEDKQWWFSKYGDEIFVSNPAPIPQLTTIITAEFMNTSLKLESFCYDFTGKFTSDMFKKLPCEIIYMVSSLLPSESILNLALASGYVQSILKHNIWFWRQYIKPIMPWFFEIMDLLDKPGSLKGMDLTRFIPWVDKGTTPRKNMASPLMPVANRRRIWGVCMQIADVYLMRLKEGDISGSGYDKMMREKSMASGQTLISFPYIGGREMTAFWVRSWDESYSREKQLETFWDVDGTLVGISLSLNHQRHLFGSDDSVSQVSKETCKVNGREWISGLILHMATSPCPLPVIHRGGSKKPSQNYRQPKGITIRLDTGRDISLGKIETDYSKVSLFSYEKNIIIGVTGEMGENGQIMRLGLIEVYEGFISENGVPTSN